MKQEVLEAMKRNIAEQEKRLVTLRKDILHAEKGGIDVSALKDTLTTLVRRIAQLKLAYQL